MDNNAEGSRPRGRPREHWINVVQENMRSRGLVRNDANDTGKLKKVVMCLARPTLTFAGKTTSERMLYNSVSPSPTWTSKR